MESQLGFASLDDCIVLSDEGSECSTTNNIDLRDAKSNESESFLRIEAKSAVSLASLLNDLPNKNEPAELASNATKCFDQQKREGSPKNIESVLANIVGDMSPSQIAEVAKHAMVDIVKQFPPLWKYTDDNYYNTNYCSLLWINIATVLNISVKTAKTRWRKLRDMYRNEYLKCMKTGIKSDNPYFEKLSFLEEEVLYIKKRADKLRSKLPKPDVPVGTRNEFKEVNNADDDDDDCMIIEMDMEESHQGNQVGTTPFEDRLQPTGNEERPNCSNAHLPTLPNNNNESLSNKDTEMKMLRHKRLSELQDHIQPPIPNGSSLYEYSKTTDGETTQNHKRKSGSFSPETHRHGEKKAKISTPEVEDAHQPLSLSPDVEEYFSNAMKKNAKMFVTHAFPDKTLMKKPHSETMISTTLSNGPQQESLTPSEKQTEKAIVTPKIKSIGTARKSTGAQYLIKKGPGSVAVSNSTGRVHQQSTNRISEQNTNPAITRPNDPPLRSACEKVAETNAMNYSAKKKAKKLKKLMKQSNKTRNPEAASGNTSGIEHSDEIATAPKSNESTFSMNEKSTSRVNKELAAPISNDPAAPANKDLPESVNQETITPEKSTISKMDCSDLGNDNENFLLSLLPEVNAMTDKQFRKLKKYSTALVSLIMDGQ